MASNSNSNFSNPAGQVSGQSFNASATSNYNRGLNPNIASGVPSIQNQGAQSRLSDSMGRGLQPQSSYNRDSSVQPSGFNQPVPPAAPRKVRTALAKNLIARYSTDGLNPAQIPGTPVRLVELLKQPIATNQRQPLVHQFWDTYFDWASLVNAQEYLRMIESLPASASQAEQAMLQTAKMVARNDVLASEIQLVKSQSKLNQFNPNRRPNDPLPIPKDLPLIGSYTTNYQWYQSNQIMPESLLGIDKMLPKTLELISLRADTVEMAQRANQQLNSGLRNRQVSLTDTLNAAKELRSAEQNLLVAVMDYNHAITDYFFTIAQSEGYLPPETIVFSLLGSRKPKTQNPNQTANRVVERFRTARGEARQPQGQGSVNFGQGPRGGGANVGRANSPQAQSGQTGFAQKRFEQTNSSSAQSGKAMPLGEASAWSREPNALQSGGSRYAGGQGTINGGQANGGFKLGGAAGQFSPSAQPQRPQEPPVINGSVAPAAPVARSGPGQFTPGAAPPGVFQPQVGGR